MWSGDGQEPYYYGEDGTMMAVGVQAGRTFRPGLPQKLFEVQLRVRNTSFAVAPDVRFLLPVFVRENAVRAMTVVLNWQQL